MEDGIVIYFAKVLVLLVIIIFAIPAFKRFFFSSSKARKRINKQPSN